MVYPSATDFGSSVGEMAAVQPPQGLELWVRVLRDWRHGWLFFVTLAVLVLGFILDVVRKHTAVYVNVGFYLAYLLLLFISGLVAFFRDQLEPDGLLYVILFGQSALAIMAVNYLLYRDRRRKSEQHG